MAFTLLVLLTRDATTTKLNYFLGKLAVFLGHNHNFQVINPTNLGERFFLAFFFFESSAFETYFLARHQRLAFTRFLRALALEGFADYLDALLV